jgi:AcrR family transcriptional regulator
MATARKSRTGKTNARKFTLRDAQKAHTHQRILDAARLVFERDGYYGATIDRIVVETGASRPTFYLHFKDKEQILRELVAEYWARGAPFMERLPGPHPTAKQVMAWLLDFGKFVEEHRALHRVLTEVSGHQPPGSKTHYGVATMEEWIRVLATRSPAFAAAARGNDVKAKARAQLLLVGLAWVGGTIGVGGAKAFTDETLSTVVSEWTRFLNDPAYDGARTRRGLKATGGAARRPSG